MRKRFILLAFLTFNFLGLNAIVQQSSVLNGKALLKEKRYRDAISLFRSIDTISITKNEKALRHFYLSVCYNNTDQHGLAFRHIINSKKLYRELNLKKDIKDCNLQLLKIISHQNNLQYNIQPIINEINEYLADGSELEPDDQFAVLLSMGSTVMSNEPLEAKKIFKNSLKLSQKINDSFQMSLDYMNIGSAYKKLQVYDSALSYTKRGLPYLLKNNKNNLMAYNYQNQGEAYKYLREYKSALEFFQMADSIKLTKNIAKSKLIFYENLADLYERIEDYENAYKYIAKFKILNDSINDTKQNIAISEIKEQFDNEKLRADNLESEAKRTQNRNIALALASLLLLVAFIAFLLQKNTKKKQRIAEQQRELEIQKTEKILKEQELTTIDAMIAGQEKERQRLASDLHDSVGATLAAAKLQFDHLSKNKEKLGELDELFHKTEKLLEDAYTEVRSMAHVKNSGVLAKDGLLPAIEKLAKNASGTNQLHIDVQDFGLEERLENSIEITVFRIIQELVTNVIKHANATEATISITQHEDSLNLMVEDNGVGFKPLKVTKTKDGMGLDNIERRVEHLEGTMDVDSSKGNGTTIVIDIPL